MIDSILLPPNYFKSHYVLTGRDWIRRISPEDRQALARHAFEKSDYGRSGGHARASKALRDNRGRFLPNHKGYKMDEKDITQESLEQIEKWLYCFGITYLSKNNLPLNTISLPDIPYNYHELYRELLRRDNTE